jgi:hypothetical protein
VLVLIVGAERCLALLMESASGITSRDTPRLAYSL